MEPTRYSPRDAGASRRRCGREPPQRTELDTRAGAIGLTENESINLLFAQRVRQTGRLSQRWVALHSMGRAQRDPRGDTTDGILLALTCQRDSRVMPVGNRTVFRTGDQVRFVLFDERADEARSILRAKGWSLIDVIPPPSRAAVTPSARPQSAR